MVHILHGHHWWKACVRMKSCTVRITGPWYSISPNISNRLISSPIIRNKILLDCCHVIKRATLVVNVVIVDPIVIPSDIVIIYHVVVVVANVIAVVTTTPNFK